MFDDIFLDAGAHIFVRIPCTCTHPHKQVHRRIPSFRDTKASSVRDTPFFAFPDAPSSFLLEPSYGTFPRNLPTEPSSTARPPQLDHEEPEPEPSTQAYAGGVSISLALDEGAEQSQEFGVHHTHTTRIHTPHHQHHARVKETQTEPTPRVLPRVRCCRRRPHTPASRM